MNKYILFLIFFLFYFRAFPQFVQVHNDKFILNNTSYTFIGTNYWYGSLLPLRKFSGSERLKTELDFLKSNGVTNLRIIAGAEGSGLINGITRIGPPIQSAEGFFENEILYGLDEILFEMSKRKMKAVIYLSNNWEWSGGFLQYLKWNKQISDSVFINPMSWDVMRDEIGKFYACGNCVKDYLQQVVYLINRKNIYSNILYKNDATIMAWEIANEPRPMRPSYIEAYKEFIRIIAADIKNIDSNHLVTTGTEGYIGTENMDVYKSIHADKNIDYLTIHIWPKNWGWYSGDDVERKMDSILVHTDKYIDDHLVVARELNKPLVIEEFGLPRDENSFDKLSSTNARNQFYNYIFKRWHKKKRRNNYLAGVNFWAYGGLASPVKNQTYWKMGDDYMGDPPMEPQGLYSVFNSDASTWKIIRKFRVKKVNEK